MQVVLVYIDIALISEPMLSSTILTSSNKGYLHKECKSEKLEILQPQFLRCYHEPNYGVVTNMSEDLSARYRQSQNNLITSGWLML